MSKSTKNESNEKTYEKKLFLHSKILLGSTTKLFFPSLTGITLRHSLLM